MARMIRRINGHIPHHASLIVFKEPIPEGKKKWTGILCTMRPYPKGGTCNYLVDGDFNTFPDLQQVVCDVKRIEPEDEHQYNDILRQGVYQVAEQGSPRRGSLIVERRIPKPGEPSLINDSRHNHRIKRNQAIKWIKRKQYQKLVGATGVITPDDVQALKRCDTKPLEKLRDLGLTVEEEEELKCCVISHDKEEEEAQAQEEEAQEEGGGDLMVMTMGTMSVEECPHGYEFGTDFNKYGQCKAEHCSVIWDCKDAHEI